MKVLFLCAACLLMMSCARQEENANVHADAPAHVPIQVSEENIVRVELQEIVTGPLISGELRAARGSTVRSEAGGLVLQVSVEEGQHVRRGDLLGRLESRALENAHNSARSAVRSAETALELARVEVRRNHELVAAGAIAQRDLDRARADLASAEAQLANARSNSVLAEEHLGDTILRSPISGIVSNRAVNSGDIVNVGMELFTIIDPSSMRLEATVPSEEISALRVGNPVRFTISGYEQTFLGRIEGITPEADPISRQVPIHVMIPNIAGRLLVGLFVEGRVIIRSNSGLVVPIDAVTLDGGQPWVLRVRDGLAERVDVTIGLRDELGERVQIKSGVAVGDILLRGTDQTITPGTPVDVNPSSPKTGRSKESRKGGSLAEVVYPSSDAPALRTSVESW